MTESAKKPSQFDIYWVNLDPTIGSEIKKIRPGIIVSPNEMNDVLKTVIIVPLTSAIINWPFRMTVKATGKVSSAACDQMRSISIERLSSRVATLSGKEQDRLLSLMQEIFIMA